MHVYVCVHKYVNIYLGKKERDGRKEREKDDAAHAGEKNNNGTSAITIKESCTVKNA